MPDEGYDEQWRIDAALKYLTEIYELTRYSWTLGYGSGEAEELELRVWTFCRDGTNVVRMREARVILKMLLGEVCFRRANPTRYRKVESLFERLSKKEVEYNIGWSSRRG